MVFRKILEIQESLKNEKKKLADIQYWIQFLQTASHNYKQSFDDQIMINLHNPQFTACADARAWKNINRDISIGHGVPTIEKQNQILKYQSHHKSDNQRSHDEMEL